MADEDVCATFARQFGALMTKRALCFARDVRAWVFLYAVPAAFLLMGMLVMEYTTYNTAQPPVPLLFPGLYNAASASAYLPTLYSNASQFCTPIQTVAFTSPTPGPTSGTLFNPYRNTGGCSHTPRTSTVWPQPQPCAPSSKL